MCLWHERNVHVLVLSVDWIDCALVAKLMDVGIVHLTGHGSFCGNTRMTTHCKKNSYS